MVVGVEAVLVLGRKTVFSAEAQRAQRFLIVTYESCGVSGWVWNGRRYQRVREPLSR